MLNFWNKTVEECRLQRGYLCRFEASGLCSRLNSGEALRRSHDLHSCATPHISKPLGASGTRSPHHTSVAPLSLATELHDLFSLRVASKHRDVIHRIAWPQKSCARNSRLSDSQRSSIRHPHTAAVPSQRPNIIREHLTSMGKLPSKRF